ncbi:acyltransferase [Cryobacterium sp. 1639]|uniref:acyltransferase family protein n=1 Tax=Cryobacterium inferilacus TaxID=2866629 RepID=UPI001C72FDDB|nr:acyltransferase [Cryobacterium sp. 1639]MBX0300973.1 acyltransferase [Cryobacterium sp. 1639]
MAEHEAAERPRASGRNHALDGMRGVAAVVVLLHHALLTVPMLSAVYYGQGSPMTTWSLGWFMTHTPLHIVWAGTEAVYLFFILSGLVLTLPVLKSNNFSWRAYYPRRLVRLYVPVLAAVAFGALTIVLVSRSNGTELGPWVIARADHYDMRSVLKDITLLFGTSGVISPLWSLRWEVLFSLLLPAYVLFSVRARRFWWPKLAITMVAIAVGCMAENQALLFLPMFALGSLFAARWASISAAFSRLLARAWAGPGLALFAILLTCVRWEVAAFGVPYRETVSLIWISVIGVALLVLLGAFWHPLRWALERSPAQLLGKLSFSLYLVHEPVILALRFATSELPPAVSIAACIPVSFGVAWLFLTYIETPSQRFAHLLGSARKKDVVPERARETL